MSVWISLSAGETVQQVFARVSAMRDRLDGPPCAFLPLETTATILCAIVTSDRSCDIYSTRHATLALTSALTRCPLRTPAG